MRSYRIAFLLILITTTCTMPISAAKNHYQLASLKDLTVLEKKMARGNGDDKTSTAIIKEFALIRSKLSSTPIPKRSKVLKAVGLKTKWGSPERYAAYYVCAWYGVNYLRTRDYLLNATYWVDWNLGGPATEAPFCFYEGSIYDLYQLYEKNHDFQILHAILTTYSDGAGAEMRIALTDEAMIKHPRGVLHIAAMSSKGRELVTLLLHCGPDDEDNPILPYADKTGQHILRTYTKRVKADIKDPLNTLARALLGKAESMHNRH